MARKVKAIELIIDWNLWPRHEANGLDSVNVARMKEALRAGVDLPPVIINEADKRVVDGFHRVKAYLQVYGNNAEIYVDARKYESDAEMFLDAARLNAIQGLHLSPKDRAHVIVKARRFKIPPAAVADALSMTTEKLKSFLKERTAKAPSGETVVLPGGAKELAGKTLNEAEMKYAQGTNGNVPLMHASMLLNALRANAVKLSDSAIDRLMELRGEIDRIVKEHVA